MFATVRHAFIHYIHVLGPWSYVVLSLCVLLEGPAATILGAAAAATGLLQSPLVFVSAAGGNLCGDIIWFTLGRLAPIRLLLRYGHWIGLRESALPYIQAHINRHCRRIMFSAKLTWVFATTALISLGMAHVPLRRWMPIDVAAEFIWTGSLVLGGSYLVSFIAQLQRGMQIASIVGYVLLIVMAFRFIRKHRPHWEADEPELDVD